MKKFYEDYAVFMLKHYGELRTRLGGAKGGPAAIIVAQCGDVDDVLAALGDYERKVLEDVYVNGLTWQEAAFNRHVSHMTIARYRKKAVAALANRLRQRMDAWR